MISAIAVRRALGAISAVALVCIGLWWGGHPSDMPSWLRSVFVANPHDVVIQQALSDVQHDYYRPVTRTGLVNGAIDGAVASLGDPYALYQTPSQYRSFNSPTPPQFSGVGIEVDPVRDGLLVLTVVPHSPALSAGLHAGDVITAVNGTLIAKVGSTRGIDLIHGRSGTSVVLTLKRGTRVLRFTVVRREIDQPIISDYATVRQGVKLGVLDVPTFDVQGIHAEVAQALEALLAQHVRGIVLDLRNNGGGLVTEAQLVASMFIPHGVIVTTRGRTQAAVTLYATGHPIAPKLPLVVLVNRDTASSAEIVTGALRDHHRAVVVGTRTYGKGVFQEIRPLSNGGAIDITVGQYYLPDGENLGAGGLHRGGGIVPNVTVNASPTGTTDPQLTAAFGVLVAHAR
ncbi:MAG: S41 family peptidase [Solirubrobacteraceae bacterium]